jgi:hypothetical protein
MTWVLILVTANAMTSIPGYQTADGCTRAGTEAFERARMQLGSEMPRSWTYLCIPGPYRQQ